MSIVAWFMRSGLDPTQRAPKEIVVLRLIGMAMLVACVGAGFTGTPHAGLEGSGLAVLVLTVVFALCAVAVIRPRPTWRRFHLPLLVVLTAAATALVGLQPHGLWNATPYFVAAVTAMLQPSRYGVAIFAASTAAILGTAAAAIDPDAAIGILVGVIPWFLFMRVLRRHRDEHEVTKGLLRELEASRAAEATAAAENERARVARDLHDVLAHSLSSLALQLESTRLLARARGADPEVVDAVARAHGIATGGLEEARRAIGALRGEDLPGPDRLPALVDAFHGETGIDAELAVTGTPRALAGDARLALYRTAQEALTNVRKHAREATRVDVTLGWEDACVRLVVADAARPAVGVVPAGAAPGATAVAARGGGYGLTGMRERAELLGGRLGAGHQEHGFRVELELPA